MSGAVIDASVAVKWVVDEPGSGAAAALLSAGPLQAPDLLLVECANVLWKKARRGELSADEARLAIRLLAQADLELLPSRHLVGQALQLAQALDHSAYYCLYLAQALASGRPLVTADARFARRIAESGLAPGQVQTLATG